MQHLPTFAGAGGGPARPAQADAFDCKHSAGTLLGGPVHNLLPDPATAGRGTDSNSFWVPDFSPATTTS